MSVRELCIIPRSRKMRAGHVCGYTHFTMRVEHNMHALKVAAEGVVFGGDIAADHYQALEHEARHKDKGEDIDGG